MQIHPMINLTETLIWQLGLGLIITLTCKHSLNHNDFLGRTNHFHPFWLLIMLSINQVKVRQDKSAVQIICEMRCTILCKTLLLQKHGLQLQPSNCNSACVNLIHLNLMVGVAELAYAKMHLLALASTRASNFFEQTCRQNCRSNPIHYKL